MYCKSETEYNNEMKEVLSSNNVTETVKQLEGLKRCRGEGHQPNDDLVIQSPGLLSLVCVILNVRTTK